jgi:hypothetical protein
MKDMIVRLDINYDQHYEPSGSRNGRVLGVSLSYRGDLAVREVDPQAAPVAYRVTGLIGSLAQCSERVARYEIRVFDGRLWWPLVGDEGLLSRSTFLDLAAAGHASARLTFDPDAWRPHSESSTADIYFARHKPRKLLESNQAELWNRVLHGAGGVIFCGGFVYVDAGEPAWFAAASDDDRLVFRIGCSSLDRAGSIYHYVPGPWQDERSICAADGLAFSLDEFEAEVRALREQIPLVQVHSEIQTLTILHRADAAVLLCEQELARSFWHPIRRRESWSRALHKALPALAAARAPNASIEDLNCREVVAQLASLEVGDDTEYDEFIMAARNIRRRLASFGASLYAEEDDAALGALARLPR